VLGGDKNTWGFVNTGTYDNLLNFLAKDVLHELAEWLETGLLFFTLLLFVFGVLKVESFLCAGKKFLSVKLLKLLYHVFINGVSKVKDFVATLLESFQEWRGCNGSLGFTCDVVNSLLAFLHAGNVFLKGDLIFSGLGGAESEEFSNLGAVGGILVDSEFEVLGELLVEFLEVFGVLLDLSEHFKAFLDNVLLDNLEDLVLLKSLTRDVKWEIFRVDYTLNEGEPFWDDVLTVVHNENSADIQFDVVLLLLGLEQIEWSTLWHEEESSKFKGSLNIEVLY